MNIYGLLHVDEACLRHKPDYAAPLKIDLYGRTAVNLAHSATASSLPFAVLSNAVAWLEARLAAIGHGGALTVLPLLVDREVPADTPFRSAHHKLDVIHAFASGQLGAMVALIDLDVVIRHAFSLQAPDRLCVYDIWDQVAPAYGAERIRADLVALGAPHQSSAWFGGEFIAGPAAAFGLLAREIDDIWPQYLSLLGQTHHTGDEMVVTAALLRLAARGVPLHPVNGTGVIARWWSGRTLAPLPPLDAVLNDSMLHLPADKPFLAQMAAAPFEDAAFIATYRAYARRQRWLAMAKNVADGLRGRRWQHLPRP